MKQTIAKEFSVSDYRRSIKLEYKVYFALIFIISIPLAVCSWVFHFLVKGISRSPENNEGILKRAWGHAQVITPMIFTA